MLESAGDCRRLLGIVRLIPKRSTDKVIAIAALMEVTAAKRFKLILGYLEDLIESHHRHKNQNASASRLYHGRMQQMGIKMSVHSLAPEPEPD